MTSPSPNLVAKLRRESRNLVREFGFLNNTLAGTDLSPSAVHALIEIGQEKNLTAKELAKRLSLDKSTVSRLVAALAKRGEIMTSQSLADARQKDLELSDQGRESLQRISRYAEQQVIDALSPLPARSHEKILSGIESYAMALRKSRTLDGPAKASKKAIIKQGYAPGLVGRVALMHGRYYNRLVGFGLQFETKVAAELSEFLQRLDHDSNQIWYAERDGDIIGSVTIDGEDLGDNIGHLRWFILDDGARGGGIGKALMNKAMDFCDTRGFRETHLWTFAGLDAARSLYERNGFILTEEQPGKQWGREVLEQKFVRK